MFPRPVTLLFRALSAGGLMAAVSVSALTPKELAARLARNEAILVIDVRPAVGYGDGHIPGAINIPLNLLPLKPLPTTLPVVVYADGLGLIDDARALAALRGKAGVRGEVLEGGYAAWLAETRLSTAASGIAREKLPGITYDQLVASNRADMVLVDLRGVEAPPTAAAGAPRRERQTATGAGADLLNAFAAKIGVPVVAARGSVSALVSGSPGAAAESASGPARAAAPAALETRPEQLLVLVAETDTAASEAARQLRASGHYRFTILIGGTETIRHEGRIGSARMDGDLVTPNAPAAR